MDYVIRKMLREDARAVSHVIAVTWNETYKGIINDEYLDNLKKNEEETAKALANNFNTNGNNYYVLLTPFNNWSSLIPTVLAEVLPVLVVGSLTPLLGNEVLVLTLEL